MKRILLLFLCMVTVRSGLADIDTDGDGLSDASERQVTSLTSPLLADTDGDGLLDGIEVHGQTNPFDVDTDGDLLLDALEDTNRNGRVDEGETNPRLADSDGDGLSDGVELAVNGSFAPTDPRNPDSDNDGLRDGIEDENQNGRVDDGETDPRVGDTDNDGLPDGLEDANRDGRVNEGETNPRLADSDGDGVWDGVEDANRDGKQGPNESSPLVADLNPTHRNDVLGVPEPLLIDWVRALGARAGEFEVNALGVLQGNGAFEVAPEVEWVPIDGLGLELEAIIKHDGFEGMKFASQLTLLSDARRGLGHGLQVVGRWQHRTNIFSLTALHLAQARLGTRCSFGVMAGIEAGTDGRVAFAFHPTIGVRLHDRLSLVVESNGRVGPWGIEGALIPHLRADLPQLGSAQLGAGPAVTFVGDKGSVMGLLALRLTWEH